MSQSHIPLLRHLARWGGRVVAALLPLSAAAQPEYSGRLPVGDQPIAYNIRQDEAREFTFILRNRGDYQVRVAQRRINLVLYLKSEAGDTLRVADARKPDGYEVMNIHTDAPVRYFVIVAPELGIGNALSGRFDIQVVRLNAAGEVVREQEE